MFRWRHTGDPILAEFDRLQRGMDDLFSALSGSTERFGYPLWREGRLFPLLNVKRLEDCFVISAEIPGTNGADLEINVQGDTVSLKGERKPDNPEEGAGYHRRERAAGKFHRSLTLPSRVDADNVKATYRNGVLTLTLPLEKASLPKQISIKEE